jgi:hypothetical protein
MTSSKDFSPEQGMAVLKEGQRELLKLLNAIPKEELDSNLGTGEWSVKDLVGHIASWEEVALKALREWRERKPLTAQGIVGVQGGVDSFNATEVETYRKSSAEEVLGRASKIHQDLLSEISAVDLDLWAEEPYYETKRPRTLGGTVGAITGGKARGDFGHVFDHIEDLRSYLESRRKT